MSSAEIDFVLARLVELARLLEQHRAAQYLLEVERAELQLRLRGLGWVAPVPVSPGALVSGAID